MSWGINELGNWLSFPSAFQHQERFLCPLVLVEKPQPYITRCGEMQLSIGMVITDVGLEETSPEDKVHFKYTPYLPVTTFSISTREYVLHLKHMLHGAWGVKIK